MYKLTDVVIEITKKCNLNCIHCGSDCSNKTVNSELSIKEWKNILEQLADMKVEKIVFSGGEPTLKKDIGKLLLFANKLKMKVGFISNGLILFDEVLQKAIKNSRPFAIGLSIDGLKDVHNKIRRNDKNWQGLMQNISFLQNNKIQVCAVTTLHKMNFNELTSLALFLDLAEIDSWQIQLAMPIGRMKNHTDLLINEEDFKSICKDVFVLRKKYSRINIQTADCFGLDLSDSIRSGSWTGCSAGISLIGIDACGNVMPCLSLQTSNSTESLREKSVKEIWENSLLFDFNRKFDELNAAGNCYDCKNLSMCRGGCASQSFSYYGQFHNSPFCYFRSFSKHK